MESQRNNLLAECHVATIAIGTSAQEAFDQLVNAIELGEWAFGLWQGETDAFGLCNGVSMLNGEVGFARAVPCPELLIIDYHIGDRPEALANRIMLRLVPGKMVGGGDENCVLSLICWRSAQQSDVRWRMTCAAHDLEVYRLRFLISKSRDGN